MKFFAVLFFSCFSLLSASSQNNSLHFDGVNDFIRVPYSATHDASSGVTIEAWVYPTSINWGNILIKGNYGYGFALSGRPGGVGTCASTNNLVYWDQSQCGSTVRSSLGYTLNTWQHVAVTVQVMGGQLRIYFYVNGVMDGPYNVTRALDNGNIDNALYIGTQGFGGGNYFTGNIEELRVWTVARTQAEIQSTMNAEINPALQTNLALYYSFNQGVAGANNSSVTTVFDRTSNSNNGTLTNFTLNGSTSNWVGASPAVLPVKLLSFDATPKGNSTELSWSTAQENNSRSFEIQRSLNNNFTSIGTVAAAGNSDERIDYHFTDKSPLAGANLYRLKQTDLDGKVEYSRTVTVNFALANNLKLQGNPVQTSLKTTFTSENNGQIRVIIANVSGARLIEKTIAVQKGNNDISIPVNGLGSGSYYLQVLSGNWKQVVPFAKL